MARGSPTAWGARSAYRFISVPGERDYDIGFRLALAHVDVETLFDQIIILSVICLDSGKKQMPFGMLVGQAAALYRTLTEVATLKNYS